MILRNIIKYVDIDPHLLAAGVHCTYVGDRDLVCKRHDMYMTRHVQHPVCTAPGMLVSPHSNHSQL